jgi:predicted metalloprotease
MRWEDFRSSDNVIDQRGGGGGLGIPGGRGGLGVGSVIVLTLVGWALGIDPRVLIGGAEQITGGRQPTTREEPRGRTGPAPDDQAAKFVRNVLGNTEDVWRQVLPAQTGKQYQDPKLVIFSGTTRSRCGGAQAAMGPFYCPLDQTVYIDLSFFNEMQRRFRAGGDFAYAYVVAHEVGHHVENVLGILPRVQRRQQEVGQVQANQLSVRVELMADCLAGVWAFHSNQKWKSIEEGDVEEAMRAAAAIGDDRLQRQSQGHVSPESFTHGSSEQRMRWFMQGLKTGQVQGCDTFRVSRI